MKVANGLPLIGKGSFTRVYKKTENTVLIYSIDPCKQCYSEVPLKSRMFPTLNKIMPYWYESRLYKKTDSLKYALSPSEYLFYKKLKEVHKKVSIGPKGYRFFRDALNSELSNFRYKAKIILEMMDYLSTYVSDLQFEISPRNVAVYKNKLILLDCFYSRSLLLKIRDKKVSVKRCLYESE